MRRLLRVAVEGAERTLDWLRGIDSTELARRFLHGPGRVRAMMWQHPVGQGLFHSGQIRVRHHAPFRYVYDCGKYAARRDDWPALIEPAVAVYGRAPLDALFISHFDVDHINGLSPLLKAFAGARTVFLPYLTPAERLLVAIHDHVRGAELAATDLDFLNDPVSWLRERGCQRVVYVQGVGDTPLSPNDVPTGDDPGPGGRGTPRLAIATEREPFGLAEADEPASAEVMSDRAPVWLGDAGHVAWVFQTYVHAEPEARKRVSELVRSALGQSTFEDLRSGKRRCSEVLMDRQMCRTVAAAYRDAMHLPHRLRFRDLLSPSRRAKRADRSRMNRSTMSLFSGPSPDVQTAFHLVGSRLEKQFVSERAGWLLTGDATLRDEHTLGRFTGFFASRREDYLARTLVFTLPHHGSEANFGPATMEALGRPRVAVIPAARQKYFRHPSRSVINLLERHGVDVFHAHERSGGFRHGLHF